MGSRNFFLLSNGVRSLAGTAEGGGIVAEAAAMSFDASSAMNGRGKS